MSFDQIHQFSEIISFVDHYQKVHSNAGVRYIKKSWMTNSDFETVKEVLEWNCRRTEPEGIISQIEAFLAKWADRL